MPIFNWASQRSEEASLKYAATANHPEVVIPLYVTEYSMPVRVQKFQDVSMNESLADGFASGFKAGFFAAPEPLQTTLSGFLITPMDEIAGLPSAAPLQGRQAPHRKWCPTTNGESTGTSLNLPYINNAELILAYMEGRMERTAQGAFVRKDPSEFVDPYGNVYTGVYVLTFEANMTVTAKRQTFSMTLWLGP